MSTSQPRGISKEDQAAAIGERLRILSVVTRFGAKGHRPAAPIPPYLANELETTRQLSRLAGKTGLLIQPATNSEEADH